MKVFYHDDLDGRCAGAIVSFFKKNNSSSDFFEVDYNKPLPLDTVKNGEELYFVDYSFTEKTKNVLDTLNQTNKIIWVDHHTSSIVLCKKYPELSKIAGIRDLVYSGAALTYMYLYDCSINQVPAFVKYVDDYDCWKHVYEPKTNYFKLGMEAKNYNALDKIWAELLTQHNSGATYLLTDIIKEGFIIQKYVNNTNKIYYDDYGYESTIHDQNGKERTCIVVNKSSNSLIFGEDYNKYDVAITWVFNGEKYIYSIYSNAEDIYCNEIAEAFGGGGHKGAAGFTSEDILFCKNT